VTCCVAVLHGREQWRLLHEACRLAPRYKSRTGYDRVVAAFGQMIRHQVVGSLDSFLANRQNDFRDAVNRSSLDAATRHQLHFINRWRAWHALSTTLTMKDGTVIPDAVRRLARAIFRSIMARHRRPNLSRVNMVIDQRMVTVSAAKNASHFALWARLSTLEKGRPVELPLVAYPNFTTRAGTRALTVQVNQRRDGSLFAPFTALTDAACGYVDKRNRPKQHAFRCLWYGLTRHADVNAARNHLQRRSLQLSDYARHRDVLLGMLVRRHAERFNRPRGRPADPRFSNPYFRDWAASVTSNRPSG
jgi:hypothetical protein